MAETRIPIIYLYWTLSNDQNFTDTLDIPTNININISFCTMFPWNMCKSNINVSLSFQRLLRGFAKFNNGARPLPWPIIPYKWYLYSFSSILCIFLSRWVMVGNNVLKPNKWPKYESILRLNIWGNALQCTEA